MQSSKKVKKNPELEKIGLLALLILAKRGNLVSLPLVTGVWADTYSFQRNSVVQPYCPPEVWVEAFLFQAAHDDLVWY